MAQNLPEICDLPDRDNPIIDLKARLKNIEDPLDPQLLENLSLFFKVKGANPIQLIKLYKECISSAGQDWEPFISILSSTLSDGVVACEYLMVRYSECLKVIAARDFPTMLSDISNFYYRQQESLKQQIEDLTRHIHVTKAKTENFNPSLSLILCPAPSAADSNKSALFTLSSELAPVPLNKFIWEDGRSYQSKIGIITANMNGTISTNIRSLEFQDINHLRSIRMKSENWEFILNRDLIELISYLSLHFQSFEGFDEKDIATKAAIFKDLASHVSPNAHQWIDATSIVEKPRAMLPCKFEIAIKFSTEGWLPINNLRELIESICIMVFDDKVIRLKPSNLFLCHFISDEMYKYCDNENVLKKCENEVWFESVEAEISLKGLTGSSYEETPIPTHTVIGEQTWKLTDNWTRYTEVQFSYKLKYSTFPISERRSLLENGFQIISAASADDKARQLKMQAQLFNLKTDLQCEFLSRFRFQKRDDSEMALIPMDSD